MIDTESDRRSNDFFSQVLASLVCQTVGGLLGAGLIDRQGRKPVLQAGAGVIMMLKKMEMVNSDGGDHEVDKNVVANDDYR